MRDVAVSIIIVNFNTKDLTKNCLSSVFKETKDISFEVIVSDNGSSDGCIEMIQKNFPQVKLIQNGRNLGFGAANNIGAKIARGEYILYLNSDTILLNNAVKCFFDYWQLHKKENIGALGCILQDKKGKITHSGGDLPTKKSILNANKQILKVHKRNSFAKKLHLGGVKNTFSFFKGSLQKEECKVGEVGYVTGADLFLKNDMYARFDENYFLYYEESDLQFRLFQSGKRMRLIDTPKIAHIRCEYDSVKEITCFSVVQSQISSVYYATKNLKMDVSPIVKIIQEDWKNPFVKEVLQKYDEKRLMQALKKASNSILTKTYVQGKF